MAGLDLGVSGNVVGGGGFACRDFLNWDLRGGRGILVKTSHCKLLVQMVFSFLNLGGSCKQTGAPRR